MNARCSNPNNARYSCYGGRGITVCVEWLHNFKQFIADMGDRPEGHTLDRKNNDKGYSPSNCKWSTSKEQASNRRPASPIGKPTLKASVNLAELLLKYKRNN